MRSQLSVVKKTAKKRMTVKQKTFIGQLLTDYYYVDDLPLGEKIPKWLQDYYVKFIRFAQWRIEQTGHGILGFVTNHSYLDNPTFRGMRQSLMKTFAEIHVYDLHGNTKKHEVSPDGSKDENVFDIQQGVSIILAVKAPDQKGLASVHHADLWGLREHKYHILADKDISNTKWTPLHPSKPNYFFFPQVIDLQGEYEKGWKLTDAMPLNVTGFQTHRDPFAIAFDKDTIVQRVKRLRSGQESDDELREAFQLKDSGGWKLADARAALRANKEWESAFLQCLYRPFDRRWCHYDNATMDRPRKELVSNMAGKKNLALNVCRQTKAPKWQHALVSDTPTPAVFVELKDGSNVFPLYLYPDSKQHTFLDERQTNFSAKLITDLKKKLKLEWKDADSGDLHRTVGPEDVFAYFYAVLSAPSYRTRYADFLKRDFPQIPLTSDKKLFAALVDKGKELTMVHLLQSQKSDNFTTEFPVKGDNVVEKAVYTPKNHRVWINAQQYFGGVPETTWESLTGGYQVCEQWLSDRKGRKLNYDDVEHWQRIVVAIRETVRLTDAIDALIPGWPLP